MLLCIMLNRFNYVLFISADPRSLSNKINITIREPTGSGQQNIWIFSQNIIIMEYLSELENLTEQGRIESINYLKSGYQNLLMYKRSDGSFSIWEPKNTKGSTFSTAMVAMSLLKAAQYIDVDEQVVNKAFDWLASVQTTDGRFEEVGEISDLNMQGALLPTKYALTTYVLMAFGENQEIAKKYRTVVEKTAQHLVNNYHNMDDIYDLSMATYSMSLIKHPNSNDFLNKLKEQSIFDSNQIVMYWKRHPVDVEVAGYALSYYLLNEKYLDSVPIARWLIKQLNETNGNSSSIQDKFVGLNALAKFTAVVSARRNDYRVILLDKHHSNKAIRKIDIRKNNSIVLIDIPSTIRTLGVEVEGTGTGFFQVQYQYSLNIQMQRPSFDLTVQLLNTSTYEVQHLKICVKYKLKEEYERSNMALVEIFLPSGLIADADPVRDITGGIMKIERQFANTVVVVYYESLYLQNQCFQVIAHRRFAMVLHMPSYVTVYDNIIKDRVAIESYEGMVPQLCDICEDEGCETLSC